MDWQTPSVISNYITIPLMFASGALLPLANFPSWMQAIASVNPVSFSALLGRGIVVFGTVDWSYLAYLPVRGRDARRGNRCGESLPEGRVRNGSPRNPTLIARSAAVPAHGA